MERAVCMEETSWFVIAIDLQEQVSCFYSASGLQKQAIFSTLFVDVMRAMSWLALPAKVRRTAMTARELQESAAREKVREKVRALIKESGLRATAPRVAVLMALEEATTPLSHSEMLVAMGETDFDPATIYRNLVKLTEAGLARVVSRAEGMSRYVLAHDSGEHEHEEHPHFVCDDCGHVLCVPVDVKMIQGVDDARWSASLKGATIQLHGACPDCMDARHA